DERTGASIIVRALEEPLRQLAYNAGLEGSVVVNQVRKAPKGQGLNVDTNEVEDLVKAGVIDPTMVTRSALQNAASIAKNIVTTEAVVAEMPEKQPAVQATRDVERLALRARRRRVSREIPRGRDQRECGVASDELVLPDGRLHALDGMEVPVLAEERSTEHRHQSCRISARDEERGDQ